MKQTFIKACVLGSLTLVSACKEGGDEGFSDAFVTEGTTVLATVNEQPITKQAVDTVKDEFNKRSRQPVNIPDERWTEELVNRELLYQEAKKQGVYKNPDIRTKLALSARSILSDAYVQDYMKDVQVSEADIQKEYDAYADKMKSPEFKARHILVKEEQTAKDIIAKLDKGGDFSKLAKEKSTGPSAKKGGELGWFVPKQMVPAFSDAVATLNNGEYTKTPVKTRFGYHVIIRDDSREKQPPSLDKMKNSIESMIKQKKLQEHVKQLRETSNVVINKTEPAPTAGTPAQPQPGAAGTTPPPVKVEQKAPAQQQAPTPK